MTQPSIGIFWGIVGAGQQPALLVDLVPLAGGETYGEFLTHGGHYEYWTKLARMGASGLRRLGLPGAPLWSEYEEWPRGRVVYHIPTRRFVIYADLKLRTQPWMDRILARFALTEAEHELRGDPHYVVGHTTRRWF